MEARCKKVFWCIFYLCRHIGFSLSPLATDVTFDTIKRLWFERCMVKRFDNYSRGYFW